MIRMAPLADRCALVGVLSLCTAYVCVCPCAVSVCSVLGADRCASGGAVTEFGPASGFGEGMSYTEYVLDGLVVAEPNVSATGKYAPPLLGILRAQPIFPSGLALEFLGVLHVRLRLLFITKSLGPKNQILFWGG